LEDHFYKLAFLLITSEHPQINLQVNNIIPFDVDSERNRQLANVQLIEFSRDKKVLEKNLKEKVQDLFLFLLENDHIHERNPEEFYNLIIKNIDFTKSSLNVLDQLK
jgi:hypothetical protein